VEQDHRGVKRVTRPMLGCKSFDVAQYTLTGVELMHMLRKGQLEGGVEQGQTPAEQFYSLAVSSPARHRFAHMQGVLDLWKRHRRPAYLVLSSEKSSYRVVHRWTIARLTRFAIARLRLMQWFASGEDFGMLSAWDASRDVGVVWYNWQIGGIVLSAFQRMEERGMTTTGVQRMTLEELHALPEGPPYSEYEEGELILVASYTAEHQDIVGALAYLLRQFVRQHRLGRVVMEVDIYLPDGRGYIPDLAYLATEHLHLLNPTDHKIHGSPDLVVEVTSSTPARDRVHKFRVYYGNGVPWYWIIDSSTLAIEEYHATPQGYLRMASVAPGEEFRPQLFPSLVIDLAALLGVEPPASPTA